MMTRNVWCAAAVLAASALTALPAAAQAGGRLIWSGNVDDKIVVSVHGRDVQADTISGKSVSDVSTQVTGRLPQRPVFVSLRGRGVRIVEQPRRFNNFTAKVQVSDPKPGSHVHRFTLVW